VYLGANRRYINTLPFLSCNITFSVCRLSQGSVSALIR